MIFARRRYYLWLVRAYIKRWRATILSSLIFGVVIFFAVVALVTFYIRPFLERKIEKIGIAGTYTQDSIPQNVLSYISYGLTSIDVNGVIKPAVASSWEIKNNGKEYIFHLKHNLYFQNGTALTAANVHLDFKDVKRTDPNSYTIEYSLKNPYEPFLTSVSKPLFLEDFVGLGNYTLKNLDVNGGFVKSISLENRQDTAFKKNFYFYPTQDSLKLAFSLGDVYEVDGLTDLSFKNGSLSTWKNVHIHKAVDYSQLVTLFYNNNDNYLSDKNIRQALTYALPASFPQGQRADSPIPPQSPYYVKNTDETLSSLDIAKTVMSGVKNPIKIPIVISTTQDFVSEAKIVQAAWKKLGIISTIKLVDGIPDSFQVFLYQFHVNDDPDQYTLWHSEGENNITSYKNLRIDKLLEDGRQTFNHTDRLKIYSDFQKYLLDDAPAAFLYFPYSYTVTRG